MPTVLEQAIRCAWVASARRAGLPCPETAAFWRWRVLMAGHPCYWLKRPLEVAT